MGLLAAGTLGFCAVVVVNVLFADVLLCLLSGCCFDVHRRCVVLWFVVVVSCFR